MESRAERRRLITDSYPLELHHVKALFLEKRYRECIATCRSLLYFEHAPGANALRNTFVRFYLALALDELARSMHTFSHAKIAAFNQAAQFYDEALSALPTSQQCLALVLPPQREQSEERHSPQPKPPSRHDSLQSHSGKKGHSRFFSVSSSTPASPPTHIRHNSFPVRSPAASVPGTAMSDFDDLESHESFNEIMTPNRLPKLERDYSSMSLLQPAQRQMTHSLMRPVRMGSPAKPYYPATAPKRYPSAPQRSLLPRLDTTSPRQASPVRNQLLTTSEEASPIDSPVSPLGSEADSIFSDTSTISPISPETPLGWRHSAETTEADASHSYLDCASAVLDEHVRAMRVQLQSHIRLLHAAKQRALIAQAARQDSSTAKGGILDPWGLVDAKDGADKRVKHSRSFWSFTPADAKVAEKQRRVQAGRARVWERERFNPARFQALAEAALAEL